MTTSEYDVFLDLNEETGMRVITGSLGTVEKKTSGGCQNRNTPSQHEFFEAKASQNCYHPFPSTIEKLYVVQ